MKISQEEIDAALAEKLSMSGADDERYVMMCILQAALTVRKQRKAAKRERQRKEKDNTIQKSAADMMTWCGKTLPEMTTDELVSARDELAGFESMSLRENGFFNRMNAEITARKEKDKQVVESVKPEYYQSSYGFGAVMGGPLNSLFPEITPSKAPEWDGTFVDKGEYETNCGLKAIVEEAKSNFLFGRVGDMPMTWHLNGKHYHAFPSVDLIRPWPKGEQ